MIISCMVLLVLVATCFINGKSTATELTTLNRSQKKTVAGDYVSKCYHCAKFGALPSRIGRLCKWVKYKICLFIPFFGTHLQVRLLESLYVSQRNHLINGRCDSVHAGARWQILFNDICAETVLAIVTITVATCYQIAVHVWLIVRSDLKGQICVWQCELHRHRAVWIGY